MVALLPLIFAQEISSSYGPEVMACPSTTPSGLLIIYAWLGSLILGVSIIGLIFGIRKKLYMAALTQFVLALLFLAVPVVDNFTDDVCGTGGYFSNNPMVFYFTGIAIGIAVVVLNFRMFKKPKNK